MPSDPHDIHPQFSKAEVRELKRLVKAQLSETSVPGEIAKQKAILRNLNGVAVFKASVRHVVSSLNARDMTTHLGWSYQPTPEWLAMVRAGLPFSTSQSAQ